MTEVIDVGNPTESEIYQKLRADYKIKLRYYGLGYKSFLKAIMNGLIEENSFLVSFIEDSKIKRRKYNKQIKKKLSLIEKEKKLIEKKFALNPKDIENIFDVIEKEYPDV